MWYGGTQRRKNYVNSKTRITTSSLLIKSIGVSFYLYAFPWEVAIEYLRSYVRNRFIWDMAVMHACITAWPHDRGCIFNTSTTGSTSEYCSPSGSAFISVGSTNASPSPSLSVWEESSDPLMLLLLPWYYLGQIVMLQWRLGEALVWLKIDTTVCRCDSQSYQSKMQTYWSKNITYFGLYYLMWGASAMSYRRSEPYYLIRQYYLGRPYYLYHQPLR